MEKKIKVTLKKRPATERLRIILKGMGLNKTNSSRELLDNPSTRGMVAKVSHLVCVEEPK
ncbi:MAG TPA: 50S ribosomal protein L30 [Deltaproteobacteria bacterium]|nr:MAG: 50S ribosomal protein L30 [Deltaproteobacteria bacterium GWA2_55_82]OGQ65163.1 MAG: 50S ribosomal protein L30 [Deltaproteobacteria bacterium RIFCSPLOWO2_02_FULL_55_12]OIJ74711.1 MAG: 50S ribosomal protein L30 [Deltaproteobacteria bacterium GWC2_55_46]HBG45633.1 50S ribosomal protein L30 [Deltaproteobacteria bacterium]HCY12174.1 50S ribosomal protein L30 [Deltaproteobacteria bacterium]